MFQALLAAYSKGPNIMSYFKKDQKYMYKNIIKEDGIKSKGIFCTENQTRSLLGHPGFSL